MGIKVIFATLSLIVLMTCEKEDDCAAVSCLAQQFSIELVNAEGVNLIENRTYGLNDITAFKDGNQVNGVQNESLNDVIFFLSGKAGNNTYSINLNAEETDTLLLNLKTESPSGDCCGPSFSFEGATYNGVEIDITKENYLDKVIVVKP